MTNRDQDLIERLKEAAAKATPGPWTSFYKSKYQEWHVSVPADGPSAMKMPLFVDGCPTGQGDAEFIALCSPDNILSLIGRLASSATRIAELEAELAISQAQTLREITASRAECEGLRANLAAEERRSAELLKRLDKAREGTEPDYCYDPDEWEFTCSWDERDQVHGYGDALPLGGVMQVATLIRGPRKWVANIPVTWDDDGVPDDTEIKWFDSEEAALAALAATRTAGGEDAQ